MTKTLAEINASHLGNVSSHSSNFDYNQTYAVGKVGRTGTKVHLLQLDTITKVLDPNAASKPWMAKVGQVHGIRPIGCNTNGDHGRVVHGLDTNAVTCANCLATLAWMTSAISAREMDPALVASIKARETAEAVTEAPKEWTKEDGCLSCQSNGIGRGFMSTVLGSPMCLSCKWEPATAPLVSLSVEPLVFDGTEAEGMPVPEAGDTFEYKNAYAAAQLTQVNAETEAFIERTNQYIPEDAPKTGRARKSTKELYDAALQNYVTRKAILEHSAPSVYAENLKRLETATKRLATYRNLLEGGAEPTEAPVPFWRKPGGKEALEAVLDGVAHEIETYAPAVLERLSNAAPDTDHGTEIWPKVDEGSYIVKSKRTSAPPVTAPETEPKAETVTFVGDGVSLPVGVTLTMTFEQARAVKAYELAHIAEAEAYALLETAPEIRGAASNKVIETGRAMRALLATARDQVGYLYMCLLKDVDLDPEPTEGSSALAVMTRTPECGVHVQEDPTWEPKAGSAVCFWYEDFRGKHTQLGIVDIDAPNGHGWMVSYLNGTKTRRVQRDHMHKY